MGELIVVHDVLLVSYVFNIRVKVHEHDGSWLKGLQIHVSRTFPFTIQKNPPAIFTIAAIGTTFEVHQPIGTDVLESVVLVVLNIVEVAVHLKAVVCEFVVVHDVLLVLPTPCLNGQLSKFMLGVPSLS